MFTHDSQEKVIQLLIKEGLVFESDVKRVVEEAEKHKQPLLANLVAQKICDAETISHATAVIMNVPYVSLHNVKMDREILTLLPYDV
ncbi:MAG: type II/IV secretion system protein, partial [Candidatus Nanosynbacter sp.]|nr:type II/IV secretion system protein [Candidatus Nanosynbacter sp.]